MNRNVESINTADHELFHCAHCTLLLVDPYQLTCGHRVCYNCMDREEEKPIKCVKCGELTHYEECHKDKACYKEIQELLVRCSSRGCRWTGKYSNSQLFPRRYCPCNECYKKHVDECDYVVERCEYCGRELTQVAMMEHLNINNYDGCSQLHRPCLFKYFGCNFEGTIYQLDRHEHDERRYHCHLINCSYL